MQEDSGPARATVCAVIPVLNEQAAIAGVISGLPHDLVDDVVVVDGGSTDGTVQAAESAGARVVRETRRGYGRACASGVGASTAEILVFIDGDGADDPRQLPLLLEPVLDGRADLAIGARARMEVGALPAHAVLGNKLAAMLISARWGQRISDLPSFKVIRRERLLALGMTEATYGWTIEMLVKAARRGYRILEVPIDYRRRTGGVSKVSGNLSTSLKAARSILATLARHGLGRTAGAPLL